MFVRQVKRKCSVRGCKNTDCFAISRNREVGNTIIICKACLREGAKAIDEMDPKAKSNIPKADNTSVPPLFFNAKVFGESKTDDGLSADVVTVDENPTLTPDNGQENTTLPADDGDKEPEQLDGVEPVGDNTDVEDNTTPSADDAEDGTGDDVTPPVDATEFKCPICGKVFDSEKGLKTHSRYCKPQADSE